eukprot:24656_1
MSKKRQFNDIESSSNEPPMKKHKTNTDVIAIKSMFMHSNDHSQFKQLFTIIDNTELSKLLHVPHFINKHIAEYSTGQFVGCNNSKCNNKIHILYQHKEIYNNNHDNANKLGYKWCENSDKYYCNECMDLTVACKSECDCLCFKTDSDKCIECNGCLCNFECQKKKCVQFHCESCYSKGSCYDCYSQIHVFQQCNDCGKKVCSNCTHDGWSLDYFCVCNRCYHKARSTNHFEMK